jgi:hypothetical protein
MSMQRFVLVNPEYLATAGLFGCYQRQSGTKNTKTSAALAAEAHDAAIQGQALFNLKDSHKVQ